MHTHNLTYSGFFAHRVWGITLILLSLTFSVLSARTSPSSTPAIYDEAGSSSLTYQQSPEFDAQKFSRAFMLISDSEDASSPHFPALSPPELDEPDKQKIVSVKLERAYKHAYSHLTQTSHRVRTINLRLKGIDMALCFLATVVMLD